MERMSFTKACLTYFGRKTGQTAMEFAQELKELTPQDRAYLAREFKTVGIEIDNVAQ